MTSKSFAYWACQILGWGSYTAIGVYMTIASGAPVKAIVIGYAAFLIYSIGLTHLLRREIKRRQWLAMRFRKSIPRLLGASVLTALIMAALVIGVSAAVDGKMDWDRVQTSAMAGSLVMFTIGWTTLYVAITSTRTALQSRLAV
ncbi:MAG TPA: hypothetical protein VKS01_11025, partial [Bryobacteraceae bacterium]|nr:hypothetical protein [Bryobacteraceae bacterium]